MLVFSHVEVKLKKSHCLYRGKGKAPLYYIFLLFRFISCVPFESQKTKFLSNYEKRKKKKKWFLQPWGLYLFLVFKIQLDFKLESNFMLFIFHLVFLILVQLFTTLQKIKSPILFSYFLCYIYIYIYIYWSKAEKKNQTRF